MPARRRPPLVLVLGILAAALVAGCGGSDPNRPVDGGTLRLALRDTLTLDPWAPEDWIETPFLALTEEGLVRFDTAGAVVPAHAREWSASADSLEYTFLLHPDRRYDDGTPILAGDYVRALQAVFASDPPSPARVRFWSVAGAVDRGRRRSVELEVRAPDSLTLVVRLWARDPSLLEKLAQPRYAVPLPPSQATERSGRRPHSGPYRLVPGGPGRQFLVRNEHYRGDARGHLDTLHLRTGVSARSMALGIASGRLDVVWPVPLEHRERIARGEGVRRLEGDDDGAIHWSLVLNCELAPLARRSARVGVAQATNRQRLVEGFAPRSTAWRHFLVDGGGEMAPAYDPVAAREALDAARYGRGVTVPLAVPRGLPEEDAARSLMREMGRADVNAELRPLARGRFFAEAARRRGTQAALWAWRPAVTDPLERLAERYLNRSLDRTWGGNRPFLRTGGEALDSLLLRGLRDGRRPARTATAEEVAALLARELPEVPLARVREELFHRPEIRDLHFHPRLGPDFRRVWKRPQS